VKSPHKWFSQNVIPRSIATKESNKNEIASDNILILLYKINKTFLVYNIVFPYPLVTMFLQISYKLIKFLAISQRCPVTCLTKRKTWTQLLLGEDILILLFVESVG